MALQVKRDEAEDSKGGMKLQVKRDENDLAEEAKKKEMEEYGKQDLSGLLSVTKQEKERTIYLFATEKKLAESANLESKGVVNG